MRRRRVGASFPVVPQPLDGPVCRELVAWWERQKSRLRTLLQRGLSLKEQIPESSQ